MARKKFKKVATDASAPAPMTTDKPAETAPLSELKITAGPAVLNLPVAANQAWDDIEAALIPWLADKTGHEIGMRYHSVPLRGSIAMTHTRLGEPPYNAADMLGLIRAFAYREMLEIYGGTPSRPARKRGQDSKAAPAPAPEL